MIPPPGYQVPQGHVCKLIRSVYGLKQASRQWNAKLKQSLLAMRFYKSWHDYSIFVKNKDDVMIILLVYMDDILVISSQEYAIATVKQRLYDLLKIKDLGEARYFLRMEITRDATGIQLAERKYALDLLKDTGF